MESVINYCLCLLFNHLIYIKVSNAKAFASGSSCLLIIFPNHAARKTHEFNLRIDQIECCLKFRYG